VLEKEQKESERNMKRVRTGKPTTVPPDELQQEYQFDYLRGKPNRFASVASEAPVVVTLDADVSCVFTTPEAVNRALRALIEVVPAPAEVYRKTRKSAGRRSE
jgi:hypothetical protein